MEADDGGFWDIIDRFRGMCASSVVDIGAPIPMDGQTDAKGAIIPI